MIFDTFVDLPYSPLRCHKLRGGLYIGLWQRYGLPEFEIETSIFVDPSPLGFSARFGRVWFLGWVVIFATALAGSLSVFCGVN